MLLTPQLAQAQLAKINQCLGVTELDAVPCGVRRSGWYMDASTGDMHYLYNGTDWLEVTGSGTTVTLQSNQATTLAIGETLDVSGLTLADDEDFVLGTGSDFLITFDATTQDPDSAFLGVGTESRQLILAETADVGTDLTIAQQTNPSLNIHSADATDASDYVLIAHNQTNAAMTTAQGGFLVTSDSIADNEAGNDDFGIEIDATINDTQASAASETWRGLKIDLTSTDVSGYSVVYMIEALDDTASIFSVTQAGVVTAAGEVVASAGMDLGDDDDIDLGDSDDFLITFDAAAQVPDSAFLGVGAESRQLIVAETTDVGTDLAIAQQTNPTLMIHSADATDAADWVSLAMDQTNGVLDVGQGVVSIPDGVSVLSDDTQVCLGGSTDACFEYDTAQTADALMLGVSTDSESIVIAQLADISTDFGHADQNTPTLYVHNADAAQTTDWISLAHNDTNGVLDVGAGVVSIPDGVSVLADDVQVCLGASTDACLQYDATQTNDALMIGVSTDSEAVIIAQLADINTDFTHADQTNPTLYVQSADQATVADYVSVAHNQTDGVIATGAGNLNLTPSGGTVAVTGAGSYTAGLTVVSQTIGIDFSRMRVFNNTAALLPVAGAADDLGQVNGTLGTNAPSLQTEDLKAEGGNPTLNRAYFEFLLPPTYLAGSTVTLRLRAGMLTTIADDAATLDAECWVPDYTNDDGTVSGDLVTPVAQNINSTTLANIDFTIDDDAAGHNLAAGSLVQCQITTSVSDGATGTAVIAIIRKIDVIIAT
jgi:hypothetical protein